MVPREAAVQLICEEPRGFGRSDGEKEASQRGFDPPMRRVERGEAKGPRREGSHKGGESDCSDRSDRTSGEPS